MGLFGNKGNKVTEPSDDGIVIVRITVDKINRHTRNVKVIIVERSTCKTVYKLRYETIQGDIPTYYEAEQYVKAFIKDNDYVIDGCIQMNVALPYIKTVNKRSR